MGAEEWLFPSVWHRYSHICYAVSVMGSPAPERCEQAGESPVEDHWIWDWSIDTEEYGFVQPGKKKGKRGQGF